MCADAQGEGGNGKSATLKMPCLLLLALRAPELGRLTACSFEVPRVNIFLLLRLKLVETNNRRCRRAHTPRPLSPNNRAKRTPKVSLLHLNLACPSETERHWKRRVLPNQNYFSSYVPSCWVTPSSSQPGTCVSALPAPLVHQGAR